MISLGLIGFSTVFLFLSLFQYLNIILMKSLGHYILQPYLFFIGMWLAFLLHVSDNFLTYLTCLPDHLRSTATTATTAYTRICRTLLEGQPLLLGELTPAEGHSVEELMGREG